MLLYVFKEIQRTSSGTEPNMKHATHLLREK